MKKWKHGKALTTEDPQRNVKMEVAAKTGFASKSVDFDALPSSRLRLCIPGRWPLTSPNRSET